MAQWQKIKIQRENDEIVDAQAPLIISASRSTDILNDYVAEVLEERVPPLDDRILTFKNLVDSLGKGRVVWRFDPLILTDKITVDDLLRKVENIGYQLFGYTEKLVFSFADIALYKKVKSNLEKNNINYSEWTENQMIDFAKRLSELNKKLNFQLATCGEKIDISQFGIQHNKCVDDDLMIRFAKNDIVLMDYLGVEIVNSLFDGEKIIKKKDNYDKYFFLQSKNKFYICTVS
ncbi:MAG: DUF1848 family protein [Bacteroidales bacterium]|nr:DUF1848 family protein [Bacteroidales bacterium]